MTLQQLIDKATFIGRQLSSCEIPVVCQGISDNLTNLELSQDNEGNYYVKLNNYESKESMEGRIILVIVVVVIVAAPFIAYFWQGKRGGMG